MKARLYKNKDGEMKQLNDAIKRSGFKKTFLAEQLGCTSVMLSYYLAGKHPMPRATMAKLYGILNISLNNFKTLKNQ